MLKSWRHHLLGSVPPSSPHPLETTCRAWDDLSSVLRAWGAWGRGESAGNKPSLVLSRAAKHTWPQAFDALPGSGLQLWASCLEGEFLPFFPLTVLHILSSSLCSPAQEPPAGHSMAGRKSEGDPGQSPLASLLASRQLCDLRQVTQCPQCQVHGPLPPHLVYSGAGNATRGFEVARLAPRQLSHTPQPSPPSPNAGVVFAASNGWQAFK